jgi:hypothetical protein
MKYKFAITIALILLFISKGNTQTNLYENWVISHYFSVWIQNINIHLSPYLNSNEKKILSQCQVQIDSSSNEYNAHSNSATRTIYFNSNLLKGIVRYSVAQLIDFDTTDFDRKRFSGFYIALYPFLNKNTLPEEAAELTDNQKEILRKICETDEFGWTITEKILFTYLHEFEHQLRDINKQLDEIGKKQKVNKDSLKEDIEFDADEYAIDKICRMDLNPTKYESLLTLLTMTNERLYQPTKNFVLRLFNFYNYCSWGLSCDSSKLDDTLCQQIYQRKKDFKKLYIYYDYLFDKDNLSKIVDRAFKNVDVYDLYNIGDFYLKETTVFDKKIDSALICYNVIANISLKDTSIHGASNRLQFLGTVEYANLLCGKIYEFIRKDNEKALAYYEKAKSVSYFMTPAYYSELINRIKKTEVQVQR